MKSCLYVGHVQHRRYAPKRNDFRYRVYMTFIDLDELPTLFDRFWLWSARQPAIAWFRRKDFHGLSTQSLSDSVRDTVFQHTGHRPTGPIRLLTHLRYFGYSFNPVSFYYVYDAADTQVETIVAEITNTPWKQRHCYVLSTKHQVMTESTNQAHNLWQWHFDKQFHVSPFMPMNMRYQWRFSAPRHVLHVHMENWQDESKCFDATLALCRQTITSRSLARALLSVPLISLKVTALIYWQAVKLFLKGVPVYTHPKKLTSKSLDPSDMSL